MHLGQPRRDGAGFLCWRGRPSSMVAAHHHDDLEVNVAVGGALVYVLGGRLVELPAGTTAIFWAGVPHQLVHAGPGVRADLLTVPLSVVLGFGLADSTVGAFLRGEPLTLDGADPGGLPDVWRQDLDSEDEELRTAALLEIQAWLRRRARAAAAAPAGRTGPVATLPHDVALATAMARHMAGGFREPMTVAQVAAAVHCSPGHAMTVFRRVVGLTVGAYLAQCRVAEAKRLLVTTDATTLEVAMRSGFSSQSTFYTTFGGVVGEAPGAYRNRVGRGGPAGVAVGEQRSDHR